MSDLLALSTARLAPARRLAPGNASLVASASNPDPNGIRSFLDVSASPVHVPAKRIEGDLASRTFPFAKAEVRFSPTEWSDLMSFFPQVGKVSFEANSPSRQSLYAEIKGGGATVAIEREETWDGVEWTITIAAASQKIAERTMKSLLTFVGEYPPPVPPEPLPYTKIPVDFWMQGPMGHAQTRRRNIDIQTWEEIQDNYPASVRDELSKLMGMEDPSGGKLILLHGPPGGGKTRAIISLMSEWRDWCGASVVTDADKLLADATYLNSIIFDSEGQGWLLLVIEDGDEFLNVNGRDSKGQSIARLLNLADGIVGQGIKLLTVISTNVNVEDLNPAVVRPGRCMANLKFGEFEIEEAQEWLAAHGVEGYEVEGPMSLAKLYALKNGDDPDAVEPVIGMDPDAVEEAETEDQAEA